MYQVRKLGVVAKAVDPVLVADALTAINTGLMAVVATLRVKFAQCVTLGVTVGGIAHNIVSTHIEPVRIGRFPNPGTLFYLSAGDCCPYIAIYKTDSFRLQSQVLLELTPAEYKKWVAPSVKHGCQLAGVTLAWSLQMTISAFHSSSRGAQLFARGTLAYLVRRNYLKVRLAFPCNPTSTFAHTRTRRDGYYLCPYSYHKGALPLTVYSYQSLIHAVRETDTLFASSQAIRGGRNREVLQRVHRGTCCIGAFPNSDTLLAHTRPAKGQLCLCLFT